MAIETANQILGRIWQEIEQTRLGRIQQEAKDDPEKHRLTQVLAPGVSANVYSYYEWRDLKRARVRWCWMQKPNAAGFYLCWRERLTSKTLKRTRWSAWKKPERAATEALRRYNKEK
jgi:hypothetical protein